MSQETLKRYSILHKSLCDIIRQQCDFDLQHTSCDLEARQIPKLTNWKHVLGQCFQVQHLFVGDFHSHQYNQEVFLTLAKKLLPQKMVFVLEAFHFEDSKYLKSFLSGDIGEDKLLNLTDYKNSWGFPYEEISKILNLAKQNQIPVYGLNAKHHNQRDQHFAEVISEITQQYADSKILTLVGELHLTSGQLKYQMRRFCDYQSLNFLANSEDVFLKINPTLLKPHQIYESGENVYSILNSTPWMKWFEHCIWEKQSYESVEDGFDFDDFFFKLTVSLKDFFGLQNITSNQLTDFNLVFSNIAKNQPKHSQWIQSPYSSSLVLNAGDFLGSHLKGTTHLNKKLFTHLCKKILNPLSENEISEERTHFEKIFQFGVNDFWKSLSEKKIA